MKTLRLLATTLLAGMLLLGISGCTTVNETGRHQLMLVSNEQATQLGLSTFQQMKQEVPISKDPAGNALVEKVGKRIAAVVDLPNAQWEFVLFESPEANAFCLPGGKVGVYTGILPITKNEAGLATVLGHEIAHATAHHGAERMSQNMIAQMGSEALTSALSTKDPKTQSIWNGLYGFGAQAGFLLPFSRVQESEADHIGLEYMAKAGYDPHEAVSFWERFAVYSKEQGGNQTPAFLRTHPLDAKRIEQLKQWMPEAEALYRASSAK